MFNSPVGYLLWFCSSTGAPNYLRTIHRTGGCCALSLLLYLKTLCVFYGHMNDVGICDHCRETGLPILLMPTYFCLCLLSLLRVMSKTSIEYLESLLCGDGGSDYEVNRLIALARADFECLAKVCTHSSLTWMRQLHIFTAIVESKLLFAMFGLCLTMS